MPFKCPHCEKKIVRYPVKDDQGNILWINLFKMDLTSILFLMSILFLLLGYAQSTQSCREIVSDPCKACENTGATVYDPDTNSIYVPLEDTTDIDFGIK